MSGQKDGACGGQAAGLGATANDDEVGRGGRLAGQSSRSKEAGSAMEGFCFGVDSVCCSLLIEPLHFSTFRFEVRSCISYKMFDESSRRPEGMSDLCKPCDFLIQVALLYSSFSSLSSDQMF